ncbi:hypothetical protein PHLGIDRAFT_22125 [Phlebiopsis gigantea 11061_1 CR5-6]|uniref:Uncharacterized protein n=1 Tax=Phlebiopsis gigantea (strain 11061_1 CR5-6) TaxID=745531 RepID=A0A0C3SEP2_PHLG1|nr:hypothetical protein PHLGIDRAFT_22125 [Phlebiopsis gigantea 11061_1 CR5-6]
MEDPETDMDVETLQAQIDLSLAHTQNLVSSWLKPKYGGASVGSSRVNQEKELEELMKRPPRLGVGAPIPSSTGVAGHEAMKLKGKLTGKKRPREEEDLKTVLDSDGEDESRTGAIKKKARQDPFAPKPKKSANAPAAVSVKPSSKAPGKQPESSSKASPQQSAATEAKPVAGPSVEKEDRKTQPALTTGANAGSEDESSEDDVSMDIDKSETPTPPEIVGPGKSAVNGTPLLNLVGPPAVTSPPKKKRKRNKKKKKGAKARA